LQRHRRVLRVEQAIERRAARFHPPRHVGIGNSLLFHHCRELQCHDPLDGNCLSVSKHAFLAEEVVEIAADVTVFHGAGYGVSFSLNDPIEPAIGGILLAW
jgi:hypothetical protein